MVLDPLHLDIPVIFPFLLFFQPLLNLRILWLIEGSPCTRLEAPVRRGVALKLGPRDAAIVAVPLDSPTASVYGRREAVRVLRPRGDK